MVKHYILSNYLKASKTFDIYRAVFDSLSLGHDYSPQEIATSNSTRLLPSQQKRLDEFIHAFRNDPQAKSVVVSNPFKQLVVSYCDELTPAAQRMQTVNLLVKIGRHLVGDNIDGDAFLLGQKHTTKFDYANKSVLILGCGGVSTAVSFKLAEIQAKHLFLYDIDRFKTISLATNLTNHYPHTQVTPLTLLTQDKLLEIDAVYNGTGIGKQSHDVKSVNETPLPRNLIIPPSVLAIDANYTPWLTKFLLDSRQFGCSVTNGFSHMIAFTSLHLSMVTHKKVSYHYVRKIGEKFL